MFLRLLPAMLALGGLSLADTITLKNGGVIEGTYLGGDARRVKIANGDRVDSYSVDEIQSIQFGGHHDRDRDAQQPPPPQAYAPSPEGLERRTDAPPNAYPPPPPNGIVIPSGTALVVRMIDPVDSQNDTLGQTYRASIDEPVVVDGQTLIPRGADVIAKLVDDKQSGKIEGRTVLTLDLLQVQVNGRMVDVNTTDVSQQSGSRGARSGKVIGGTAVLGTIIGALAGGGRGAAIGAASGAAVGTGAEVLTKGQRVRIPSETRLTFTLQQPLQA
jgi:hypothetical protein